MIAFRICFAVCTLALSASPALAQGAAGGGHGKADFIASYDTDGDSAVTRAEFDSHRADHFAQTDFDHRNNLSEAEYVGEYTARLDRELAEMRARQIAQARVRFGILDSNDDDAISADEFGASGARMFGALDTNNDGSVDERDTTENY